MEAPTDPSLLIWEVYHNLLLNIFKQDQPQVIGSIRLGVIKETIHDLINFGHFWSFGAPMEAPTEPSPLILEVFHNLL